MRDGFKRFFDKRLHREIKKSETKALEEAGITDTDLTDGELASDADFRAEVSRLRFKARREIVKQFLRDVEDFKWACQSEYQKELKADEDRFPTGWMEASKGIMKNLSKKGNRIFFPLMNALCRNTLDMKQCQSLMGELKIPKIQVISKNKKTGAEFVNAYEWVIIRPLTAEMRARIAGQLKISNALIYHYIKEMEKQGILKALTRTGRGGLIIYAVGYWTPFQPGKFRAVYFLKNSPEMRKVLKKFDALKWKKI